MSDPKQYLLIEQQLKQYWINQTIDPSTSQEQDRYFQNLMLAQAQHQQILTNHFMAQHVLTQQNLMATSQVAPQQPFSPQIVHQQFMPESLNEKLLQLHPDDPCFLQNLQTPQTNLGGEQSGPFRNANLMNQDNIQQTKQVCSMEQVSALFQQPQNFPAVLEDVQREKQMDQWTVDILLKTVEIKQTAPPNPSKPIDVETLKSVFGDDYKKIKDVPRRELIEMHDLLVLASRIQETPSFDYVENMGDFSNFDLINRIMVIGHTINLRVDLVKFITKHMMPGMESNLIAKIFTPRFVEEKNPVPSEGDGSLNSAPSSAAIPDPLCNERPRNPQQDCVPSTSSAAIGSSHAHLNKSAELDQSNRRNQIEEPMEGEPLLKKMRVTNENPIHVPAPEFNAVIESSSTADQNRLVDVEDTIQVEVNPTNQDCLLQDQVLMPKAQSLLVQMQKKMKNLSAESRTKFQKILHLLVIEFSKEEPPKKGTEFFDLLIELCKEGGL